MIIAGLSRTFALVSDVGFPIKEEKEGHLDYSKVELPSNRKFGYFFSVIFLIAAGYNFFLGHNSFVDIFCGISITLLLITLFKPSILLPLNKLWFRLGMLLGMIFSPILIGFIFYGMFSPIAIFMRFLGRDELKLRLKKQDTYWVKRQNETNSSTFKNQF